ncbi:hypothetical protein BS78_07G048200 [Paspalum vaginatum]|nr:hypothetical protein BS78_07G048200 [Paspalum vaginatum]
MNSVSLSKFLPCFERNRAFLLPSYHLPRHLPHSLLVLLQLCAPARLRSGSRRDAPTGRAPSSARARPQPRQATAERRAPSSGLGSVSPRLRLFLTWPSLACSSFRCLLD